MLAARASTAWLQVMSFGKVYDTEPHANCRSSVLTRVDANSFLGQVRRFSPQGKLDEEAVQSGKAVHLSDSGSRASQ